MKVSNKRLFEQVLKRVQAEAASSARAWFTQLELIDLANGVMRVRTRNTSQTSYLERQCHEPFASAAQAVTGRLITVAFETDAQTTAHINEQEQADDAIFASDDTDGHLTLDRFIVGPCNQLAHAAAIAVTKQPGHAYNPLFIYGSAGLGKTHLLQGIYHALTPQKPVPEGAVFEDDSRLNQPWIPDEATACGTAQEQWHTGPSNCNVGSVCRRGEPALLGCFYVRAESFVRQFTAAMDEGPTDVFRNECCSASVLLIDDAEVLARGERSQEEFFHIFNALQTTGRQVVLTADRPATAIPGLTKRLATRFQSGLTAALEPPCYETRLAILKSQAQHRCIELPNEVAEWMAQRAEAGPRQLVDDLTRIDQCARQGGTALTLDTTKTALQSLTRRTPAGKATPKKQASKVIDHG